MLNVSLNSQYQNSVAFGRKLKSEEKEGYKKAVQGALKQLDKNNVAIIAQGPSFPSLSNEDTGMGSPYTSGAVNFMNFLDDLGFNCVQLGPSGKTKRSDASPYTSTVFSDNTLFIDLKALTTSEWGSLLKESTFDSIVKANDNRDTGRVSYEYAFDKYDEALREAWSTYKAKHEAGTDSKAIQKIATGLKAFEEKNQSWLKNDALYEALAKANGNDYWGEWSDIDKKLPAMLGSSNAPDRQKAEARLKQVMTDPALVDEMEFYKFCQYIISEQKDEIKAKVPVNTIADIQVTYSDRDWWAFQNLFLDDYRLGVPPDYFSKDGQAWGFPVIDPDQLFEKTETGDIKKVDGKPVLLESGKLIKTRFDKMFRDNPGGVRIDHIVGLIDPWVYPGDAKTAKVEDGGRRMFSSPEKEAPFDKWANVDKSALNEKVSPDLEGRVKSDKIKEANVNKYAGIIDIIIQSAKDNNVPLSNIICEDLGTLTNPTVEVLKERGLSGLRVTQFVEAHNPDHIYRGKNVASKQWIVTGTHDNDTIISWTEGLQKSNQLRPHAKNLAKDLNVSYSKIKRNSKNFIKAKFAELFASPAQNVQIMFTDFFGMKDRYNDPGAKGEQVKKNWRVRVPNDYQDFYYKQLINGHGVNLPEVLEIAMNSKDKDFVAKNKGLIEELHKYAQILKMPGK